MTAPATTAAVGERPRLRDTWPIHRRQLAQLGAAYLAITAAFVLAGLLLTKRFADSSLLQDDVSIERWFVDHRTPTWTALSWWGSMLAETSTKVVLTVVVCGFLLHRYKRWYEATIVAVPLILEAASFLTITLLVRRPRPDVPRLDGSPVNSSFPSGHTAAALCYAAIVVVVALHASTKRGRVWFGCAVVAFVTVAVGVARMYRGMHHLTDVAAGVLLGAVSVMVSVAILVRTPEADGT